MFLRKLQAHFDNLESSDINCSSIESQHNTIPVVSKTVPQVFSLPHTLLLFFSLHAPAELCSGVTYNIHINMHNPTSNVIWFESKMWIEMHKHTHNSIIKASVGPGERWSWFQLLSCLTGITVYSSVAVTASQVHGTRSAWPCWVATWTPCGSILRCIAFLWSYFHRPDVFS